MNATTDPAAIWLEPAELTPHPRNPRKNQPVEEVAESIAEFGFASPIVARAACRTIIAGHTRLKAAHKLGLSTVPVRLLDVTEEQALRLMLSDNRLAMLAAWDDEGLAALLRELDDDAALPGFDDGELEQLLEPNVAAEPVPERKTLVERFLVPPFSVLDSRQGYWQERKRAWHSLGIDSGKGREDLGTTVVATEWMKRGKDEGGSIFDPVLAELAVRWFCPPSGKVLDPFAGGSVRGIVTARLGRHYTGIDVRQEQVEANQSQWDQVQKQARGVAFAHIESDPEALTPIEKHGEIWVKRDDCFVYGGTNGNKVRTTLMMASSSNAVGLVGVGSRHSPQITRVARVAQALGIPARVHVPEGKETAEMLDCIQCGAEVVRHPAGYNTVIKKRAADDANERGWTLVPFAGESLTTVACTKAQFANVAEMLDEVGRIVVPVGSGMTLSGVLQALHSENDEETPVVGVCVGADPEPFLDRWAPKGWRSRVNLVRSELKYSQHASDIYLGDVALDPVYEAKCLPYLQPNDLLWVVGVRESAMPARRLKNETDPVWICGDSSDLPALVPEDYRADLVLTCPPYFDLEVYSDNPQDISNAGDYAGFREMYGKILRNAVNQLAEDRFAVIVIGDVRDKRGVQHGLVADTVQLMSEAGASLYNDAVYVTPAGSLPIRTARAFNASRKMGKTHQYFLVFYKGDPANISERFGPAE